MNWMLFARSRTPSVSYTHLGKLADVIEDAVSLDYAELPHFGHVSAPGHQGRLVLGYLGDKAVMCMQGRLHCYEGHSLEAVTYPCLLYTSFLHADQLVRTDLRYLYHR